MSPRNRQQISLTLMGIVVVIALPACATRDDLVRAGALQAKRESSAYAEVSAPSVRQVPGGTAVRGEVTRPFANRGPIRGHVHLVVIDPAGNRLTDTPVELTRASVKARSATYHAKLPIEIPDGSTLGVTHYVSMHGRVPE